MAPRRLARGRREGARTWAVTGTLLGMATALGLCALIAIALSPALERPAILVGSLASAALLVARPRALERLVERAEALASARRAVEARLHDFRGVQPFGMDVEGVVVREGTRPAWAPVGALTLRQSTGASVVAILRGARRDPAPLAAETVVHPGDELVVAGTPAQLVAARRYLLDGPAPRA